MAKWIRGWDGQPRYPQQETLQILGADPALRDRIAKGEDAAFRELEDRLEKSGARPAAPAPSPQPAVEQDLVDLAAQPAATAASPQRRLVPLSKAEETTVKHAPFDQLCKATGVPPVRLPQRPDAPVPGPAPEASPAPSPVPVNAGPGAGGGAPPPNAPPPSPVGPGVGALPDPSKYRKMGLALVGNEEDERIAKLIDEGKLPDTHRPLSTHAPFATPPKIGG